MADRGRDLKIAVLSDVDKFDLSKPADELDTLADSAKDASKSVDTAAEDIQNSGKKIDDFGDKADSTAKKVDDAFDRIAKSSRSNFHKVDADAKDAKQGLDDFKDEAHQSGREAAASFSGGFDDITDLIQETAANAFGGFGALGGAAGIAAAAGIGLIVTSLQAANERLNELKQGFLGLITGETNTQLERAKVVLDDLAQNGQLVQLSDDAKRFGIDWQTLVRALSGSDTDMANVRKRLEEIARSGQVANGVMGNEATPAFERLRQSVGLTAGAYSDAKKEGDLYNEGLGAITDGSDAATAALEKQKAALDAASGAIKSIATDTSDLTTQVQTEAQKQADATKDPSDSWTDYADNVKLSAKDIIDTLDEQTKAAENFRDNLLEVQKRGDDEFLSWVSQQPPAVAKAYAEGTAAEKQSIYAAFKRNVGAQMGLGIAQGLSDQQGTVVAKANSIKAAVDAALSSGVAIPTYVEMPNGAVLSTFAERIKRGIGTIDVRVRPMVGDVYIPNRFAMRGTP